MTNNPYEPPRVECERDEQHWTFCDLVVQTAKAAFMVMWFPIAAPDAELPWWGYVAGSAVWWVVFLAIVVLILASRQEPAERG